MTGLLISAGLLWLFVKAKQNAQKPATLPGTLNPNPIISPEVVIMEGVVVGLDGFEKITKGFDNAYKAIAVKYPVGAKGEGEFKTIVGQTYEIINVMATGGNATNTVAYKIKGKMVKLPAPQPTK